MGVTEDAINEVSGMAAFYDKMVAHLTDDPLNHRGWVILALIRGVDEVSGKLADSLNTISIICGLLLSSGLAQLMAPPAHIQASTTSEFFNYAYMITLTLAVILHFSVIVLNSLIVNLLNTAARKADRLTIMYEIHKFPTVSYLVFTLGNLLLAFAISISLAVLYNPTIGFCVCLLICSICGALMNGLNSFMFLKYGHVIHGWKKKDKKVIERILKQLESLAIRDANEFISHDEKLQ